MNRLKSGHVCAARSCNNKSYDDCGRSFFRFPKDPERARKWLINCHREELLDLEVDKLYHGYRLCSDHFDQKMFTNTFCNRLNPNAVPLIFPALVEYSKGEDHTYTRPHLVRLDEDPPAKKIRILDDVIITTDFQVEAHGEDDIPTIQSPKLLYEIETDEDNELEILSTSSSTQTSNRLSSNSPRKIKYRQIIKSLRNEHKMLKKKIENLENQHKNILETIPLERYLASTYRFCSEETAKFINNQVSRLQKHPKGRRYSDEFEIQCLALFFAGPKEYKHFLMKTFSLPTPETLMKQIRGMSIYPGLENTKLYKMLKLKVDCFQDQNKYCVLCIDEMSIKANLFYNRTSDSIIGLAENEKNEKIFQPALTARVLMLRGIYSNWKQPLAYYFCHTTHTPQFLKSILNKVVDKLSLAGLKLCAVTSDMESNYLELTDLLGVTPESPHFIIGNQKMYYVIDVFHIVKAIRNILHTYDFIIDGKIISWKFIEQFYEHDKNYPVRAAPSLTHSHICPTGTERMKVKLATQVFSAKVATSMNLYVRFGYLPSAAIETAEFVGRMDKLIDILNSSQKIRAFKGEKYQTEFLNECLDFFEKLEVKGKKGANIKNKIKCFKSLKVSINSVISLWDDLHRDGQYDYLLTGRINLDGLKNHFEKIRRLNGNNKKPTPIQFQRAFRKLQSLDLFHSDTEHCDADLDPVLLRLNDIPIVIENKLIVDACPTEHNIDLDYQNSNILKENFFRYVCGYLLKETLKVHSCGVCIEYSNAHKELDDLYVNCFLKDCEMDIFGEINTPNDNFVNFITKIEIIFQKNFEDFSVKPNICGSFMEMSKHLDYSHPCPLFPKLFVTRLYIRVTLYYSLKNINRNFKKCSKNKLINWRHI